MVGLRSWDTDDSLVFLVTCGHEIQRRCFMIFIFWCESRSVCSKGLHFGVMAKRSAEAKGSPKAKAMKTDSKATKLEPLCQLVELAPLAEMSKSMLVNMAPHCLGNGTTHEFQLKMKEMLEGVTQLTFKPSGIKTRECSTATPLSCELLIPNLSILILGH